jgi:hypothetical protein
MLGLVWIAARVTLGGGGGGYPGPGLYLGQLVPLKFIFELTPSGQHPNCVLLHPLLFPFCDPVLFPFAPIVTDKLFNITNRIKMISKIIITTVSIYIIYFFKLRLK